MKKRVLRLFRRQLPSPKPSPEFGVPLTLKKGDKIVSRDAGGEIRMTRVGEDQPHHNAGMLILRHDGHDVAAARCL